ncbi:MAG: hypothetical protein K2G89_09165 [Lachnospiraceae bacterium]|nr:hypothetical protein [Lachnospiraceae bacterium]
MKQRPKFNLIISAVAMMGALMVIFYLIMVMPERIDLIITFGAIVLADTYFLADGILKRIDDISNDSLDKQTEMTKVEKGIYSVAKREESILIEKLDMLVQTITNLQADNQRLNDELIEQQKLLTKLSLKKDEENISKMISGNDRIAKLIIQLTSNNNTVSKETLQLLNDISDMLEDDKKEDVYYSKVQKMPPRAE